MCGIAGYVQRRAVDDSIIRRMTARLAHRGPDGQGIHVARHGEWNIGLGHRRLSIIDVAGGGQPLANETGNVWISFNGEIYNFASLRTQLESRGHRFATHCDTESIVHHYEEHGVAGLTELDGMFAFAIWDAPSDHDATLLLARDRVGIKPLYYAPLADGGIVFASELSAILQHPDVKLELDQDGLASFLFSDYAQPPLTLVRGVRKLQPGHYLRWTTAAGAGGAALPQPYWSIASIEASNEVPPVEPLKLQHQLDSSVAAQLMSDVPIGMFLSGGIDSSFVAALAQRHVRTPLQSFSIAFEEPQFDESRYARCVARHIGSRHVEQTFDERSLLNLIDEALNCLDEPIGDASILPTFALSRLASRHVKVVLGGDGGDELWAGYPTYLAHRYALTYQRITQPLRAMAATGVRLLRPGDGYQSLDWKAKRFVHRWDNDPAMRHLRWMSSIDLPDLPLDIDGWSPAEPSLPTADALNSILALDFQTYLPGSVLTKVDRASMAHGLEVRPPMLGNAMIDFAFSLPSQVKLAGRTTKALLKRAARGVLPDPIIHRPKKGFAIPLSRWLKGPLRPRIEQILRTSPLWDLHLLHRDAFTRWADEHRRRIADRSKPLWALLVLDHWYRAMIGAATG